MGRIARTTDDAGLARRTEDRLRELDRRGAVTGQTLAGVAGRVAALETTAPRGEVDRASRTTNVAPMTGAAWYTILTLTVPVLEDRKYLISARHGAWVDGANPSFMNSVITYTTDGSTPTPDSPALVRGGVMTPSGTITVGAALDQNYTPDSDGTLRLLLIAQGPAAAGTYGVQANNGWATYLAVYDIGAIERATADQEATA